MYIDIPIDTEICGFISAVITPFIEPWTLLLVKIVARDKHELCNGRTDFPKTLATKFQTTVFKVNCISAAWKSGTHTVLIVRMVCCIHLCLLISENAVPMKTNKTV